MQRIILVHSLRVLLLLSYCYMNKYVSLESLWNCDNWFIIWWLWNVSYFYSMNIQIEWLTAGECIAGMHEVVVSEKTTDAIKVAQEQKRSLWRVSSTVSDLNAFNPVFFTSVTGKPCLYLNSKNVTVTLFSFFSFSRPVVCTYSIRCSVETPRSLCELSACWKISPHLYRRICRKRACRNQS